MIQGTSSKRPRKAARDPRTGKFEGASPLTDPALMAFAVRTVRAIQDLEPLLARGASSSGDEAKLYAVAGLVLSLIKDSMLRELAADPESYKEAKKKRLEAARLGNVPLAERDRIMRMAQAWLILPSSNPPLRPDQAELPSLQALFPNGGDAP